MQKITPKLDRMFLDIPLRKLLIIDIACPLIAGFLAFFLTRTLWIALAAAFAGILIIAFIIKRLEALRRKKFASQLVDGLMLLSSSLNAGLSLLQALNVLIEEMPPPISQEFSLVVRENRVGVPLEECLAKMKRRMDSPDLDMIITVILVSRETGGNLTTIFSSLVTTIRERNRLVGRVRALCTQGRLQGRIMMFLPVAFVYGVYKLDPSLFNFLLNDPQGRIILWYAFASELVGIFLINLLSKVEV